MLPFSFTICAEAEICDLTDGHTSMVSITDPGARAVIPDCMPESRILRMAFHDLDALPPLSDPIWLVLRALGQHPVMPSPEHIRRIIRFADGLREGERVLVHCKAGVSRSTAAATIIGCRRLPGREAQILAHVRDIRPQAMPNRLMIEIADRLLQAGGHMIRGRERLAPPAP